MGANVVQKASKGNKKWEPIVNVVVKIMENSSAYTNKMVAFCVEFYDVAK